MVILVTAGKLHKIVFWCYFTRVKLSLVPSHCIPYLVENVRSYFSVDLFVMFRLQTLDFSDIRIHTNMRDLSFLILSC